jgi:endo-1,4-beta-D-glucanase Y
MGPAKWKPTQLGIVSLSLKGLRGEWMRDPVKEDKKREKRRFDNLATSKYNIDNWVGVLISDSKGLTVRLEKIKGLEKFISEEKKDRFIGQFSDMRNHIDDVLNNLRQVDN